MGECFSLTLGCFWPVVGGVQRIYRVYTLFRSIAFILRRNLPSRGNGSYKSLVLRLLLPIMGRSECDLYVGI